MILICKCQTRVHSEDEFTEEQREDLKLPDPIDECEWVESEIDLSLSLLITEVKAIDGEDESDTCAESNGCTWVNYGTSRQIINVPFDIMKIWYGKKNIEVMAEYSETSNSIVLLI